MSVPSARLLSWCAEASLTGLYRSRQMRHGVAEDPTNALILAHLELSLDVAVKSDGSPSAAKTKRSSGRPAATKFVRRFLMRSDDRGLLLEAVR